MSKMNIEVEFLAGTSLKDALEEAKQKAEKWDVCYVCFKFNNVGFSIGRNADTYEAYQEWDNGATYIVHS